MALPQYSLSWAEHPKNITNGLSYLQQNGEFVDMTLAADGHLVKVHQVIMALSSPFLKDLIASAKCSHPVIVLNKISHTTLAAILEYVYTGEVLVAIEDIKDLIDAAKDLHIKGLQEMNLSVSKTVNQHKDNEIPYTDAHCVNIDHDVSYYEIHIPTDEINRHYLDTAPGSSVAMTEPTSVSLLRCASDSDSLYEMRLSDDKTVESPTVIETKNAAIVSDTSPEKTNSLQYTVSTHGSLQLILNRFLYYLKNTKINRTRQWRCVDYLTRTKCPAFVITRDNIVLQRILAHKHPFHDKKILKKMTSKNVYTALVDAERSGMSVKSKPMECTNESE